MTASRIETITSAANPRLRPVADLRTAAGRRDDDLTLVDGRRELSRAVAAGLAVTDLFVDARLFGAAAATLEPLTAAIGPWVAMLADRGTRIVALGPRPFERIAFGARNEGVVGVVRFACPGLATAAFAPDRPVLLIEGVEKPGNLGAILRTADAAGLAGVVVCDGRTDPANPAVIRASLGTAFSVPLAVATTADAIPWCREHRRRVVAATPQGRRLWHEAALAGPTAILLGSEAHGISSAWEAAAEAGVIALDSIRLPMHGCADSLNLSATAAVLAYESVRQETAGH
jgi:TrmH family RNA methyltransferase